MSTLIWQLHIKKLHNIPGEIIYSNTCLELIQILMFDDLNTACSNTTLTSNSQRITFLNEVKYIWTLHKPIAYLDTFNLGLYWMALVYNFAKYWQTPTTDYSFEWTPFGHVKSYGVMVDSVTSYPTGWPTLLSTNIQRLPRQDNVWLRLIKQAYSLWPGNESKGHC